MDGKGSLFYESGRPAYKGMLQKDQFHGVGILFNDSPVKLERSFNFKNFEEIEDFWTHYEGSFMDDLKEGKGILLLTNGEKYVGEFHGDKIDG